MTAAGRFGDQNVDTVLTLRNGYDSTNRAPEGHCRHFALTPDSLVQPNTPGEYAADVAGGQDVLVAPGPQHPRGRHRGQLQRNGPNVKLDAVNFQKDVGDSASWTAVALPAAGADVFALVNHQSGRCLGIPSDNNPNHAAFSYDCPWGSMPAEQQWTSIRADALINKADGLALTVSVAGWSARPLPRTRTRRVRCGCSSTGRTVATRSPPTASRRPTFSRTRWRRAIWTASRCTATVFMYHDEAAIAWLEDGRTPTPPHIRVVDYAATGVIAPAPVDLATALPAPGTLKTGPERPRHQDWYAGTLGLAPGDFDGDSLNELAYTWQDAAGAFHVTMLEYRAAPDGTRSLNVVGPVDGLSLFGGSGAPTPDLDAGMAETKAGDFDGDGRDDLAITFAATPTGGGPLTGYLGVVSFTQDLGIRGQQFAPYTQDPVYVDADGAGPGIATRGLKVAPGLFRFDPEAAATLPHGD